MLLDKVGKDWQCVENSLVDCKVFPFFLLFSSFLLFLLFLLCVWSKFQQIDINGALQATHRPCASEIHCSCVDRLPPPQQVLNI